VTYGHDSERTAAISARSDVRMLWGGDQTVATIKAVPAPPGARDIAFADRHSFAVIRAGRFLALGPEPAHALLRDFYNDTYWFGQMGCSSPRALIWIGDESTCAAAAERFADELAAVLREQQFVNDTGAALEVMNFTFVLAAGERRVRIRRLGNELTVADCGLLEPPLDRDHCGHGFFRSYRVDALDQLVPLITRKDQTMTQFGLEAEEIEDLVRRLAGRGLDRLVSVGSALAFGRYWDGYDLLQELTRRVAVAPPGRRPF
jgi:Acyl-CoA reductase (LuxC)